MTDLRITSPCAAKWNEMTPVAGGRHCDSCAKTVIDLTCLAPVQHDAALRRVQAEIRQGHHFCLRALTTRDGRILSSSRRILTGGMAAMLAVTLAGCHGTDTGPNHV